MTTPVNPYFLFLEINFIHFYTKCIPADSRWMFRGYDGVTLLCELFEKHKDLGIAQALEHVINRRYGTHKGFWEIRLIHLV